MPVVSTSLASTLPGVATYELADFASLLVTATGVISAEGANAAALVLGQGGSAFIQGTIFSAGNGIDSSENDVDVVIAAGGLVTADDRGVLFAGAGARLENAGEIAGITYQGVNLSGAGAELVNSGRISGAFSAVDFSAAGGTLTNTGTISGGVYGVQSFGGSLSLTNAGTIMTTGTNTVAVRLEGAGNVLVNTGSILSIGNLAVSMGGLDTIGGFINRLTNEGLIASNGSSAIGGGANADYIVNNGTIEGLVGLFGGADFFDGRGGRQASVVDGGQGNDSLLGGASDDWLTGVSGADSITGGAGNDLLDGGDGADTIRGDAGADTLSGGVGAADLVDYSYSTGAVWVDLPNSEATGGDGHDDVITGFEGAQGSGHADTLTGDGAANRLAGGAGRDVLTGGLGNDTLLGQAGADSIAAGQGADTLAGGNGADTLVGGAGNDRFQYLSANESSSAARDRIADFVKGQDRIDLSAIDANAVGGTANDTFVFVAGGPFVAAGQVRFQQVAGTTEVWLNTDADFATAEAVIVLSGLFALAGTDFVL
jgi:Ca2+-binding RTX toxin-like protein